MLNFLPTGKNDISSIDCCRWLILITGCKIDTKLTYNYLRSFGKQDFKFCVNSLRCNTQLDFIKNNQFTFTIIFGGSLPDIIDEELNFLRPLTHAKSLSKLIVLQLAIFLRNPSHQFLAEMDFLWIFHQFNHRYNNKFSR